MVSRLNTFLEQVDVGDYYVHGVIGAYSCEHPSRPTHRHLLAINTTFSPTHFLGSRKEEVDANAGKLRAGSILGTTFLV